MSEPRAMPWRGHLRACMQALGALLGCLCLLLLRASMRVRACEERWRGSMCPTGHTSRQGCTPAPTLHACRQLPRVPQGVRASVASLRAKEVTYSHTDAPAALMHGGTHTLGTLTCRSGVQGGLQPQRMHAHTQTRRRTHT